MALQDLLQLSNSGNKVGISEERVAAILPVLTQYVAFWREYPDIFVDFLIHGYDEERAKKKEIFHFYFYQRLFLRCVMRYKYTYMVFPRAYSKSFLSVMALMIQCVLYPGAHLFVTSGGKEQAAQIIKEKVQEICTLIPAFRREINWDRGVTQEGKDYCKYIFKNGSWFDNVAARESSRGKRRHAGLVEECVGVDGDILSQVIIPTMNVSRQCMDGSRHPEESLNKSQNFVTTAGYKGTFAYQKLIQFLIWMVIQPEKAFIMGGTYKIPVLVKLLDANFISDLKQDGTFNEAAFDREYNSVWSGTVEDAFFDGEAFARSRKLQLPEKEASGKNGPKSYYVLSVDVGRKGCDTVICILKVNPQQQGPAHKSLVNMYTMTNEHFEDQAIKIKQLYFKFNARTVVLDANGLGIGLVDYMVKSQNDSYGDYYPPFGVENDDEGFYKRFKTDDTEQNAMYLIKANAPINSEAHANVQAQLLTGKLRFLIDERTAKMKLMNTKVGQNMKPEERAEYLKPFTLTSILCDEMNNLREEHEGVNIILKQANRGIRKDKFSAFEYGLYYIKLQEDKKRHKHGRISDFMFFSPKKF